MTFFTVHIVTTPDDNGTGTTFDNLPDAIRLARWAREQGCWFVAISR